MKHIEGNFKSVRDLDIYYQGWVPDGKVKAVLFIVHGLGEHSGRYMNVVNHFVPLGYAVYGFDNVGHGKSGGGREQVVRFEDLTAPLATYYTMVKSWQPDKPIFILGHSLGGLIECFYLLDHQEDFKGAIISAPSIAIGEGITSTTIALAKVLSVIAPKAGVMKLDASMISRDPEVVKVYVNDPLVFHGSTPARMGAEMLKALLRVNAEIEKITLPFIGVQGSKDTLADPKSVKILEEKAKSKDKTTKIYEGLYHEVFNEPERLIVLKDVEDWLKVHI
jgi:acylglycerol lipase